MRHVWSLFKAAIMMYCCCNNSPLFSSDILDQRHPHEDIPLQDLHITQQDQLSDVGSFRPPVGGVPVYGRVSLIVLIENKQFN